jgi:hypothetical protein
VSKQQSCPQLAVARGVAERGPCLLTGVGGGTLLVECLGANRLMSEHQCRQDDGAAQRPPQGSKCAPAKRGAQRSGQGGGLAAASAAPVLARPRGPTSLSSVASPAHAVPAPIAPPPNGVWPRG